MNFLYKCNYPSGLIFIQLHELQAFLQSIKTLLMQQKKRTNRIMYKIYNFTWI
jgi:hypothetical protein